MGHCSPIPSQRRIAYAASLQPLPGFPTLTSVSRQSIFSGKPPIYFPSSIHSTNSEKKLWEQFWEDHGLARLDIVYERSLGNADLQRELEEKIHSHKTRVAGLVVDTVDKIMHGMQLGSAGMHNQIKTVVSKGLPQWADRIPAGLRIQGMVDIRPRQYRMRG